MSITVAATTCALPPLPPTPDLRHDAARDLKDVLASHIPICPRVRPAGRRACLHLLPMMRGMPLQPW